MHLQLSQTTFTVGYYADPEAKCQVFHICTADGKGGQVKYSFLCPNGTIFNQNYFICDWWFNFDCNEAEGLYSRNQEIAAERDAASAAASDLTSYGAPPPTGYSSQYIPAAADPVVSVKQNPAPTYSGIQNSLKPTRNTEKVANRRRGKGPRLQG